VTIAFNLPLNDALAKVKPSSIDDANLWASYLRDWAIWNHVRTVTALAATALFAIASMSMWQTCKSAKTISNRTIIPDREPNTAIARQKT
jgi:hypothetical protein